MNRVKYLLLLLGPALALAASLAHGTTVVWSDGFETNATNRWQSTGVWSISQPSSGPGSAHSGTNCASTQGYGYNQSTWLICTNYGNGSNTLRVPSADQWPRLRFWHWFNFANAGGHVSITTNWGTNWTQVSPDYKDLNGGGVWSRPYVDLSAYAGQNIIIAFYFISGGCCGNGLGWYVDDVEVDTDSPGLAFPEGFEAADTNDWSVDAGTWAIGRPNSGPGQAHQGANCAGTSLGAGNYANNVDSRLISPPFLVPNISDIALHFWQCYSFNNAGGYLEINTGIVTTNRVTNNVPVTGTNTLLNTNIYIFVGANITDYTNPFYWNPTLVAWTNSTKAIQSVYDTAGYYGPGYYFEAGTLPITGLNVDYWVLSFWPDPQSPAPTNTMSLQAANWTSLWSSDDNPVGYFMTNTTPVISTNTTITGFGTTWTPLSPTYKNISSSGWVNTILSLTNYIGQGVQLAFHFTSGGLYTAAGWYVDDLILVGSPTLNVPGTQTNYPGQSLAVALSATNAALTNVSYTFNLFSASTNYFLTNGVPAIFTNVINGTNTFTTNNTTAVLTWTNTGLKNNILTWTNNSVSPGSNIIYVRVQDNSAWTNSVTNQVTIVFVPPPGPHLLPPTNASFYVGQVSTNVLAATNEVLPGASYNYAMAVASPGATVSSNELVLTNATRAPVVNYIRIKVTDNSNPPLQSNNLFSVTILPYPSDLSLTNLVWSTNNGGRFEYGIQTPWTNTAWRIQAATNLAATNWTALYTNQPGANGPLLFTDLLATNFLQRYYRAVFP